MIKKEKLILLYEEVVDGKELTTKLLKSYGFHSNEITFLVENGTLKRIKRGQYSFMASGDLYQYCQNLMIEEDREHAFRYVKKCYELDSTLAAFWLKQFLQAVCLKNYEEVFKYFDYIYKIEKDFLIRNNLYLFLLSMVMELPLEYKVIAKQLKLNDMISNQSDYGLVQSIFQQKFNYAIKQYNQIISRKNTLSLQDTLLKALLVQAKKVQEDNRKEVLSLIHQKEYEKLVEYLDENSENHLLSLSDESLLLLSKDVIAIKKTGKIPPKKDVDTNNLFYAISCKNYEKALFLCSNYHQKYAIDCSKDPFYSLLIEIFELTTKKQEMECSLPTINHGDAFLEIMQYMMKRDFDRTMACLRGYLKNCLL